MLRCERCKHFVKNVTFMQNGLGDIKDVIGWCKHCHARVPVEYDDYEDVVSMNEASVK
jgi:hypothetical protein